MNILATITGFVSCCPEETEIEFDAIGLPIHTGRASSLLFVAGIIVVTVADICHPGDTPAEKPWKRYYAF
jgi:hypothetical protein